MSQGSHSSIIRFGDPEKIFNGIITPVSSSEIEPFIGIPSGLLPDEHPVERLLAPNGERNVGFIERTFWLGAHLRGEKGIVVAGKDRADDATNTFYIYERGDVAVSTAARKHLRIPFGKSLSGGLYREDMPRTDGNMQTFTSQRTLVAYALFAVLNPESTTVRTWNEVRAHARQRRA